jgi:hypothetical protein
LLLCECLTYLDVLRRRCILAVNTECVARVKGRRGAGKGHTQEHGSLATSAHAPASWPRTQGWEGIHPPQAISHSSEKEWEREGGFRREQ